MVEKKSVNINGKNYYLKSGAIGVDPEELAVFVDNKMQELLKTKTTQSTTDLAILTAINLAQELKETQVKYQVEKETIQRKVGSLVKILSKGIENIE